MTAVETPPAVRLAPRGEPDLLLVTEDGQVVEVQVKGEVSRPAGSGPEVVFTVNRTALLDALLEEQTPEQERARLVAARTRAVTATLGGVRATARLLGVAPSQVSRWASGQARPGAEQTRRLLDLDHVIAQAHLLWDDDEAVRDWLTAYDMYLGARPIDVTILQGSAPVVEAIRAAIAGAYA